MASERDAELAQRAAEGDRICRQLLPPLMGSDAVLDGGVESLKMIDARASQLRGVMNVLNGAKDSPGAPALVSREAVYFMVGAYLGEMVRRGLVAKGAEVRWEAGGEGRVSMGLSNLVIRRVGKEERWAVFADARDWLDGRLVIAFYERMNELLSSP